jgi:Thermopsin
MLLRVVGDVIFHTFKHPKTLRPSMAPGKRLQSGLAVALVLVMAFSALSALGIVATPSAVTPASTAVVTPSAASAPAAVSSEASAHALGINKVLANAVAAKEATILADGGNLANFHPPNLHQAPPLKSTEGAVIPLYSIAPAPLGQAYYGESNTTGTIQPTVANTTSLAGTWSTTDTIGTAAEIFDTSSGNSPANFGAQLNTVLVNVTIKGDTSFAASADADDPGGCPTTSFYNGLPGNACPNEFWLQNYIQYSETTHVLTVSNEIWNFSNPTANFDVSGTNTLAGFGSVEDEEVYQGPSSGNIVIAPPFSLALYLNYTQGPCHLDSVAGTGIGNCGTVSTTQPVNELFMNYTIRNSLGERVCPTSVPTGRVCGEDDDIFFNSVPTGASSGVPLYGPNGRVGSATIQANGTGYDPLGLTNDWEFDYGIGSDDGATNYIEYSNGIVGLDACSNAVESAQGAISCSTYSAPPAATDYGGETGETSTGEAAYWAPQGVPGPGPSLLTGAATPIEHLVTGPSLLVGLWNMTGSTYTGSAPYPLYTGAEPLSYANIAPANAWVGIARDTAPGVEVTTQSLFQVAPTFGYYSYWKGSGGATTPTALGSNLWLPTGWYTIEVMLSGYDPVIQQINLTAPAAPSITLNPDASTGAYTPDYAFSNSDLANLTVSPTNTVPTGAGTTVSPYMISVGAPNVGTVDGVQIGVPGSVSWLFSNLNDYLFTQWMGAYVNSTTAVTQFNPAPSFPMEYPSWQDAQLGEFNIPTTDGFQYYLMNTQNLAVIGATDLYAWGNSEATSIYSVVVNNGVNDLIADNTFMVSNRGLDFTGGGTTHTFTVNGVVVAGALPPARNVVWGNTFVPDPQLTYTGLEPFTAQDSLTLGEAYDRVYNNAFEAYSPTVNATANAGSTDVTFWNATCQAGYNPLSAASYPGPTVCEPLSYAQSIDGYTMTGSIVASNYQGGNYWAGYGNAANPYANLPYKARLTSVTGMAEIASTVAGFAGDYAPLITTTVYKGTFTETGLPSSATTTTFAVHLNAGFGPGTVWLNQSATSATPAGCAASTICVNFYLPNGTYNFVASKVTISSVLYAPNPAVGTFTVAGAAWGPTAISYGVGYTATFTESGLPDGSTFYVNVTGQSPLAGTVTAPGLPTVSLTVPSGSYPYTVATNNALFAPSAYSGTLTVSGSAVGVTLSFSPVLYPVTFTESGLPGGNQWSATIGATTQTSTSTTAVLNEENGTYSYSVASADSSYAPTAYTGSVAVTGAPAGVSVTFELVTYSVSFSESGLPSADTWYVNVTDGPSLSGTGATTTLTTALSNGTYSFTVATNDVIYAPSYYQSTVTVAGASASAGVSFSSVIYAVDMTETGLPSHTLWSLTLGSQSGTTTSGSLSFEATNGTYAYSAEIAAGGSFSGSVTVHGSATTVSLVYRSVKFVETSLPVGTAWQVTTNAVTLSSTSTTIQSYLVDGHSYAYQVGLISGYHTADHGSFTLVSTAITVHVPFTPTTYTVKFTESGFKSAWKTNWCVTFGATTTCVTGASSISFTGITNGSYSYMIGHVANYTLNGGAYTGGSLIVSGGGQGELVATIATHWTLVIYGVTFSESGLVHGTSWEVTVDGKTKSTTGTSLSISVSNGTYSFQAISTGHPTVTGTVTVDGSTVTEHVTFT